MKKRQTDRERERRKERSLQKIVTVQANILWPKVQTVSLFSYLKHGKCRQGLLCHSFSLKKKNTRSVGNLCNIAKQNTMFQSRTPVRLMKWAYKQI